MKLIISPLIIYNELKWFFFLKLFQLPISKNFLKYTEAHIYLFTFNAWWSGKTKLERARFGTVSRRGRPAVRCSGERAA